MSGLKYNDQLVDFVYGETETTKVPEQYQKQAEEEITEENMDEELENIEQELEAEMEEQ